MDRINTLRAEISKAVTGLKVDVAIFRSPDQDFLDVRAFFHDDPTYDFECTWTLAGFSWSEPGVLAAVKDGNYGDVEGVETPQAAQLFFDAVGKRIGGYGRLSASELALLSVVTDADFDFNEVSGDKLREAIRVLHRELAFRTPERLVETLHGSSRLKEHREHQAARPYR
ncbi:hypothetical protein OIU34_18210 [Pararhizobium sp. BT-229]|uniref:hypothetical protein n=1 Tax=Pararhizobium sp. BT-229 TaxID=2986923 RepID=UPI0021F7D04C|nr:hypothetical protein [Pararhizobium sp. BT-229]MCV9963814.1 hypothetical protein [Pararhizobium sp. BT-229]